MSIALNPSLFLCESSFKILGLSLKLDFIEHAKREGAFSYCAMEDVVQNHLEEIGSIEYHDRVHALLDDLTDEGLKHLHEI